MNKIKGMLIGAFLGDALGTPFERHSKIKYTGDLTTTKLYHKDRFGHETTLDYGQCSDDSEMTIILFNHIKKHNNTIDKDSLILDYIEWANHKTSFALGKNTRALFKGIKTLDGYKKRYDKRNKDCQSNGALMRCSPLVLVDQKYWSIECAITNPNKICIETNMIYLNLLKNALNGIKPNINTIDRTHLSEPLIEMFKQLDDNMVRDITKQKGWCVHGLYCALHAFNHYTSFGDAMKWIIESGGDTDTNATITGALYGAYYGYDELYKQQKKNIDCLMNCTTENGNKVRPMKYLPKYINELI